MAFMATQMENLALSVKSLNDNVESLVDSHRSLEERMCAVEDALRHSSSRQPDPQQQYRDDNQEEDYDDGWENP